MSLQIFRYNNYKAFMFPTIQTLYTTLLTYKLKVYSYFHKGQARPRHWKPQSNLQKCESLNLPRQIKTVGFFLRRNIETIKPEYNDMNG